MVREKSCSNWALAPQKALLTIGDQATLDQTMYLSKLKSKKNKSPCLFLNRVMQLCKDLIVSVG